MGAKITGIYGISGRGGIGIAGDMIMDYTAAGHLIIGFEIALYQRKVRLEFLASFSHKSHASQKCRFKTD
jgi:hypothetical protein